MHLTELRIRRMCAIPEPGTSKYEHSSLIPGARNTSAFCSVIACSKGYKYWNTCGESTIPALIRPVSPLLSRFPIHCFDTLRTLSRSFCSHALNHSSTDGRHYIWHGIHEYAVILLNKCLELSKTMDGTKTDTARRYVSTANSLIYCINNVPFILTIINA